MYHTVCSKCFALNANAECQIQHSNVTCPDRPLPPHRASGFNYHGSEPLYNGLTGQVMQADIFMGVVFYQRLR